MPRKAEAGSGLSGRKPWLGTEDWLELAKAEAIVVFKRVERVEDYESPRAKEKAEQYKVEVIVCHSKGGERTGEYYPPFKTTSRAIVSKFGDPLPPGEDGKGGRAGAVDGEVIGARIVAIGSGSSAYPAANEPSGPEWEAVEKFYAANEATFDEAGDAKLFATFAKRYADERRAGVRETVGAFAGKGGKGGDASADGADDEPPC
jgi:hypothetical protein